MRKTCSVIATPAEIGGHALVRSGLAALAIVAALVAPVAPGSAEEAPALRLCADPTNLPFSSDNPSQPGLYLEIGQAIAQSLGRPVTYDWYKSYFGKRTVRVTLLGKQCDAMIGLPLSDDFMGPAVIFSSRIATESYALVSAKDQAIATIDDLRGKRVAVQFETTPQNLLALHNDITLVTVLSPDEGMKVLDQGKADVAFICGPVAGWLNKTSYNNRFRVQPTEGHGLAFDVAIGFAKGSTALRDQINATLPQLQRTIEELAVKYGVPTEQPIKFSGPSTPIRLAAVDGPTRSDVQPAQRTEAARPAPSAAPAVKMAEAPAASAETISAGKEMFNGTCAHCHGPDAVQSERRINLRLLHNRYGEDMREKFWVTVHEGRPAKGMPAWKEVFTDDQFENIYSYLLTVQAPPE